MNILREWEYQLVPGPNLSAAHRYFAGTSAQRIEDLTWAMTDPEIDAVWFARGGYGTVQVLDDLPWDDMDDRPVIGFSDATAMFAAMSVRGKGHAIHAPVIHSLADHVDEISRRALKIWMRSGTIKNFPGKRLCGHTESVAGEVVGGNLLGRRFTFIPIDFAISLSSLTFFAASSPSVYASWAAAATSTCRRRSARGA